VKAARRGVAVDAQPLGGLPQPHLAGQGVGLLGQLAPLPVGATVLAPLLRSRRAEPVQCQQLKWFAFVIGVCVVSVLVAVAVQGSLPLVATVFWDVALAGVVAGIPAAVDLAILRYRLYDIDRLINRAVVCASLTAVRTWVLLARYWRWGSALSFARRAVGTSASTVGGVARVLRRAAGADTGRRGRRCWGLRALPRLRLLAVG
jgi:hypothetical protein